MSSGPLRKALGASLKEIRIHGCQTSQPSAGVRAFITSIYPAVKAKNPDLPILIREASGTPPRAFVRLGAFGPYRDALTHTEQGREKQISLADASDGAEVERRIASLL